MRPHGQTTLGFFPLPIAEAKRRKNCLLNVGPLAEAEGFETVCSLAAPTS